MENLKLQSQDTHDVKLTTGNMAQQEQHNGISGKKIYNYPNYLR